jgi:hypothetical protein
MMSRGVLTADEDAAGILTAETKNKYICSWTGNKSDK